MELITDLDISDTKLKSDKEHLNLVVDEINKYFTIDLKVAKSKIDELQSWCEKNNLDIGNAWTEALLGKYYKNLYFIEKAVKYHQNAYKLFKNIGDKNGEVFVLNELMTDYIELGLFDIAIDFGIKGICLLEENKINKYIELLILNIAIAYLKMELYEEAYDTINELKNLKLSEEIIPITKLCKADIELNRSNLVQALNYCNEAEEAVIKNDLKRLFIIILYVKGKIYYKLKNFDYAINILNEALEYSVMYENKEVQCLALLKLALIYKDKKCLWTALEKIKQALKIAEEINKSILIIKVEKELIIIYELLGNYEEAYRFCQDLISREKAINNQQSTLWLAMIQNKHVQRKARQYKALYHDIDLLSKIGQKITSDLRLEKILDNIFEETKCLFKVDVLGIALYNQEQKTIQKSLNIYKDKRVNGEVIELNNFNSYGAYCVRNKEGILVNDEELEYSKYIKSRSEILTGRNENSISSFIYCPLIVESKITGFINIQSYEKNVYSMDDYNKLKILASYIAIAIENATLFKDIDYLAKHDFLTGLYNRNEILIRGKHCLERKFELNTSMSVIMIDIDNFKLVNDTYGHLIGDQTLKIVAKTILKIVNEQEGMLGRYGGEEFLVMLSKSREETLEIANNIRKAVLENKIKINKSLTINVSISLGVYNFDGRALVVETGINYADAALYLAKKNGKNRIEMY